MQMDPPYMPDEEVEAEEYEPDRDSQKEKVKWTTLSWNGLDFPPEYTPHGKPIFYDGEPILLNPEEEEVATWYAQMLNTDYVTNPVFQKNFLNSWRLRMRPELRSKIFDIEKIDFMPIYNHLQELKELKKNRSKEEKDAEKAKKQALDEKYGWCLIDGRREKVGNYHVEPPGLFRGRGQHPKMGIAKKRIEPEDLTINIGKGEKVPEPPVGHSWKRVQHDNTVTWLATWNCSVTGKGKCIFLGATAAIRQKSDLQKFETARELKKFVDRIRETYREDMESTTIKHRQRGTALYLIDKLALRVGGEKDEDEADTVGCCSLRVEHVRTKEPNIVEFDFLGKDSIQYHNSVAVDDIVYENICRFRKLKDPTDGLFDKLSASSLNNYLKKLMPGLSAKVFRTYNASITLNRFLKDPEKLMYTGNIEKLKKEPDFKRKVFPSVADRVAFYSRANKEVAILCNHQKTLSKTHDSQMGRLREKERLLKLEIADLKNHLKKLKSGEIVPVKSAAKGDKKKKPGETKKSTKKEQKGTQKDNRTSGSGKFKKQKDSAEAGEVGGGRGKDGEMKKVKKEVAGDSVQAPEQKALGESKKKSGKTKREKVEDEDYVDKKPVPRKRGTKRKAEMEAVSPGPPRKKGRKVSAVSVLDDDDVPMAGLE